VDRSLALGLRVIGLIYLAIGIYVLFRRWTAPRATHFYLFCLVSFALYALKYTGSSTRAGLDRLLVNVLAESLQPALFLHFALSFPRRAVQEARRRWLLAADLRARRGIARPVALGHQLLAGHGLLKHRLDQTGTAYDAVSTSWPPLLFLRSYSRANTPLLRQQLKWLTRGALLAVVPFHAVLRHSLPLRPAHAQPAHQSGGPLHGLFAAHLQLGHRPLPADGHRPDLQARRGLHAGHRPDSGRLLRHHRADRRAGPQPPARVGARMGLGIAILVAAIFDPLKRRIQGWVDKVFDRHRYDYRKALVEFGRGLSSETDLQALLESIVERLPRTLLVARVAVFLARTQRNRPPAPGRLPRAARRGARGRAGGMAWASSTSTRPRTTPTSSWKTRSRPCICPRTSSAPPPCST
jgi:two-component system NtrC family sensor kinase